ncbi:hypothetical protein Cgig2_025095 [Carnegiea gigantea]|uniref:Uncharacterized protein n=1 Tax=Carnegiea gigantea TaxID=171969 RepID=A0A9Q1KIE7_9CARY|nr:hypothetical protein Cgig2_025095 [Carnegiea gigantea]
MATDHKWASFETWTAVLGNCLLRKYKRQLPRRGWSILHVSVTIVIWRSFHGFPCSLSTKEMAEYVVRHFVWDQRGAAFPPLPLPKDFQALCSSYKLAVAEEAVEDYEFPELPQEIFYAMLLNKAERLGVLHGSVPDEGGTKGNFRSRPTRRGLGGGPHVRLTPLPEDYHVLCPHFSLPEAEGAATDFELPEMMQATFYAMLLNEAVELGVVHGFMVEGLRLALVGLRWSSFEAAEYICDHFRWPLRDPSAPGCRPLPSDYHGLYPRFDLGVAMRYACDSDIPKMVQIIFYAMIINDAVELDLSCRLTMDCVMWAMRKLDWGPMEAWLGDNGRRLR